MKGRSALEHALFLLGQRSYSEKNLRQKLDRRYQDSAQNEQAIARLKQMGLIDDLKFARSYLASKSRYSYRGSHRIVFELKLKGVADELVRIALMDYSKEDQLDVARKLVENRLERLAGLDDRIVYRRIASLLSRRGFEAEIVRKVLQEKTRGQSDHESDS